MPADQPARAAIWPGVVALVWIGLLIGVSLLATPVKFRAPSLDLPVALDVGRHTFAAFNLVEIFALALLALAIILGNRTRLLLAALAGIAAVLVLQTVWLLPALDARVEIYLSGAVPPASALHTVYVVGEGLKLLILAGIALLSLRRT
jgi:hypothetical protein